MFIAVFVMLYSPSNWIHVWFSYGMNEHKFKVVSHSKQAKK